MMKTPLKDTPREDRERAIDASRGVLLERYYRLREELDEVKANLKQLSAQKIVLQGLELPVKSCDAS